MRLGTLKQRVQFFDLNMTVIKTNNTLLSPVL